MRIAFYIFIFISCIMASPAIAAMHEDAYMQEKADNMTLDIAYPILENPDINKDLQRWVSALGENFWAENRDEAKNTPIPFGLNVTYKITRPSKTILSIMWEIASYTGGAHGNLEIVTMTYDLTEGILLAPLNLFENPDIALQRMSHYAFAILSNRLPDVPGGMLRRGVEPILENFSTITFTPSGIRIYFPPYQVAPWAVGLLEINMPLSALEDAKPDMTIWGKPAL